MLRRIFGPERDEVIEEWRRLHNKELYVSYCSPNINQVIKSRHVARIGHRSAYRVLVRKPQGRRPLGRPRRRWEDNIKMDLNTSGMEGMD